MRSAVVGVTTVLLVFILALAEPAGWDTRSLPFVTHILSSPVSIQHPHWCVWTHIDSP
jgi:hypothetical protein